MNEEFDTRRWLPKNLEGIISNRETLIELSSHGIKEGGVGRRRGVWVGCESNSPIAINRGSKGQGQGAVGLFNHSGHDVGEGSSHDKRIVGEGRGSAQGKETTLCGWEWWGSFRDTILA